MVMGMTLPLPREWRSDFSYSAVEEQFDEKWLGQRLIGILTPLGQVEAKSDVETYLSLNQKAAHRLLAAMVDVLLSDSGPSDLWERVGRTYNEMREQVQTKSDLFTMLALEQFHGALDSLEAFGRWGLEIQQQLLDQPDAKLLQQYTDKLTVVTTNALYAQLVTLAIMAIILDKIDDWRPESIPVLAAAADDYMVEVEDVFLTDISFDQDADGPPVAFEDVRKELGL